MRHILLGVVFFIAFACFLEGIFCEDSSFETIDSWNFIVQIQFCSFIICLAGKVGEGSRTSLFPS